MAIPSANLRPGERDFDFGEALDIDLAADGAGLVEAIALDVDGLVNKGGFLKGKAGTFGCDLAGGGDEPAAVVNGATGLVAEEVGVDVSGSEGA